MSVVEILQGPGSVHARVNEALRVMLADPSLPYDPDTGPLIEDLELAYQADPTRLRPLPRLEVEP